MGCAASCDGGTTTDTKSSTTAIVSSVGTADRTNLSIPQPRLPPSAPFVTVVKPMLVHHPPVRHGDSHHLVSLVSTTYGYDSLLVLDPQPQLTTDGGADENLIKSSTTVINAWELMDGLLDNDENQERRRQELFFAVKEKPKPLWKHLSEESLLAEMDPSVASTLRRRIPPIPDPNSSKSTTSGRGTEKDQNQQQEPSINNNKKQKAVLYTTTLRGIRRTYEDCCIVRTILKGIRVAVDEKDVSMDSGYRNELNRLLCGKPMGLPRVFVGDTFIGGVDEVRQMNETGELKRFLDGFDVAMEEEDGVEVVCCGCGGVRFLPCWECGGSRKVFVEEEGQVKRCSVCNENGLVRCRYCCCC